MTLKPAPDPPPFWLRLDNAAKIYPAVKNQELTAVFRISAVLKERVKAKPFLLAVEALENRFPYYKVVLQGGFFWYYLEHVAAKVGVHPEEHLPCRAFHEKELLYRILVRDKQISVEFSHILTDGSGALEFLKSLVLTYFDTCRSGLTEGQNYLRAQEMPEAEEYEDAYKRYFQKATRSLPGLGPAFHLKFPLRVKPRFQVLMAHIPLSQIVAKAKALQLSLTDYLVAVYLYSLQGIYKQYPAFAHKQPKNLRIEVPHQPAQDVSQQNHAQLYLVCIT